MGIVRVEGIQLRAYHGCMEEEATVGSNYIVDVVVDADFTEAAKTDDLSKTVDYVDIYNIVKKEMDIRSKLIEHVAQRIADSIKKNISRVLSVSVTVKKLNPPIGGFVEKTSVTIQS